MSLLDLKSPPDYTIMALQFQLDLRNAALDAVFLIDIGDAA